MEEDEVKTKLSEIYQNIIKYEEELDWSHVKEDLSDLNWLDFDSQQSSDMIISVWKVADRWGVSVLQSNPRFKLLKITKIKLQITNYLYNIQNDQEIKAICKESRGKIEDMLFFSCAKSMLYAANEETLPNLALKIYDIFQEFKSTLSSFFIHFDKQLKIEINATISKLLEEIFYQKVIFGLKAKLLSDPSTKKIIDELDKAAPIYHDASTYSDNTAIVVSDYSYDNNVYATSYNNQNAVYLRTNLYHGQLNEDNKRHGYGKITYFGGDTYQGYWDNDKAHGQGLYSWKIGGKYLGNFTKGSISGYGKRIYSSGNMYTGEFLNGKKYGKGEMLYKNGDKYEGEWFDDFLHGEGMYCWNTGDTFVGMFVKDLREGRGILTTADGNIIEGIWKDNALIGN